HRVLVAHVDDGGADLDCPGLRAAGCQQRKRRSELAREVVHPEIRTVRAELLGRDGEVDGLQQRVGAGARLRLRRRGPMAEGEEADFFHGNRAWGSRADVSRRALSLSPPAVSGERSERREREAAWKASKALP